MREDLLTLSFDRLSKAKYPLCHLHGSYKFVKRYGKTYKLRTSSENTEPVIVFNRPDSKGYIVANDNVLSEYMRLFRLLIGSANTKRLVILGNSMEMEPHLKQAIKELFNRNGVEVFVVSRGPHKITEQLRAENYFTGEINEITTDGIGTEEDLIKLFEFLVEC